MKFYLSLASTIALIISLSAIIISNKHDFFSNKWNVISTLVLLVCIIVVAVITILYGIKMFDQWNHATIIVKVKDGKIYFAGHTNPQKECGLSTVIGDEQILIVKLK